jgi:hypothetical protein
LAGEWWPGAGQLGEDAWIDGTVTAFWGMNEHSRTERGEIIDWLENGIVRARRS